MSSSEEDVRLDLVAMWEEQVGRLINDGYSAGEAERIASSVESRKVRQQWAQSVKWARLQKGEA